MSCCVCILQSVPVFVETDGAIFLHLVFLILVWSPYCRDPIFRKNKSVDTFILGDGWVEGRQFLTRHAVKGAE